MSRLRTLRQGGFLFMNLDDAPTRNALNPEMVQELGVAMEAAAADAGLRAMVLRGEGAEGAAAFRDKRDAAWVEKIEQLLKP
jgi:enoyl-CoA hydratase/carnithine racemase